MKHFAPRCLFAVASVLGCASSAQAEIVTYFIDFAQSGQDVEVGSTVNWTLSVQITDSNGNNRGIRELNVDLINNQADAMTAGAIGATFSNYAPSGGTGGAGSVTDISALLGVFNSGLVVGQDPSHGGNLGPLVLATGSYQVNTIGMHTLTTVESGASTYFNNGSGAFTNYEMVNIDSDSLNVVAAVPEPASLLLASTLLCPAVIAVRRRRRRDRQADLCA